MTSREPQSAALREAYLAAPPPPKPPEPEPKPAKPKLGKGRRIVVKKPRNPYKTRWSDLTPEEMASFRIHPEEDR